MWTMLAGVPGKLKTLADRLTATRAANLDKLDANITTRAAAATALSNAVWSDARAGKLDSIGIKSIQRGSFTWGGTELTKSVTISSVTPGRALLLFSFTSNPSVGTVSDVFKETMTAGNITGATTLGFSRGKTVGTGLVEWQVIEFF